VRRCRRQFPEARSTELQNLQS